MIYYRSPLRGHHFLGLKASFLSKKGPRRSEYGGHSKNTPAQQFTIRSVSCTAGSFGQGHRKSPSTSTGQESVSQNGLLVVMVQGAPVFLLLDHIKSEKVFVRRRGCQVSQKGADLRGSPGNFWGTSREDKVISGEPLDCCQVPQ